ncbi:MAG: hypothetical protein Kapaf2KO_00180 [Candidatus Kapaibacteriales bacterium]
MTLELDKYTNDIILTQVKNGGFSSPEDFVKQAIKSYCVDAARNQRLAHELEKGKNSGYIENFDKDEFLKGLHKKYNV